LLEQELIVLFHFYFFIISLQLIINQTNLLTMRKFQLLAGLLLITGLGLFTSCSKDSTEDLTPSINFIGGTDYVTGDKILDAGAEFKFGINASANANSGKKLTNFKVVRTFNNVPDQVLDTTFSVDNFNQSYITNANTEIGTERWTFTITDKDGESKELSFVITTKATAGDIHTYTTVLLAGQLNPNGGSFYSTVNDSVMTEGIANLNQSKVDLIYYYGTTKHNSIVAPASAQLSDIPEFSYILNSSAANHWTTTNQTKFKDVTSADIDWSLVTNDALITANAVNMTDMFVNDLAANKIIAFETASTSANPGKKGLFKVTSISGTTGADRTITIEVKIQK
jgi:hypothetical protein